MPARIILNAGDVAIARELQAGAVEAAIAPRSRHAVSSPGHTWQSINAADRFLIKVDDLLGRFVVAHYRDVDGEDMTRVHAGLGGLHGNESFQEHAGASEEHEGSRNLDDGKRAQAAIGATGDANAAAGCKTGRLRNVGAWEARNIREEDGCDYRESGAN